MILQCSSKSKSNDRMPAMYNTLCRFPMKKICFLIAALFSSFQLHALYQSNPSTPDLIDEGFFLAKDAFMAVKAGYQRDQVFDRKLKAKGHIHGEISEVAQLYDQGVLIFNFMDRVELFGSAGSMSVHITDTQKVMSGGMLLPFQFEYQTHNDFTWGAGLRAAIIEWSNTTFGASASVQYAHPKVRWNTEDGTPFNNSAYLRWVEWQFGAALSHHIDIFTPYIGVNYSKVHARIRNIASIPMVPLYPKSFKMRSRDHFGLALGCDLSTGKIIDIGVEVRMISEQAITLKGDVKF